MRTLRTGAIAALLALLPLAPARALPTAGFIAIANSTYVPGDNRNPSNVDAHRVEIKRGEGLGVRNFEPLVPDAYCAGAQASLCHTVTSDVKIVTRPLFDSYFCLSTDNTGKCVKSTNRIGPMNVGFVSGLSALGPGTYKFHCQVHPTTMKGVLIIA